MGWIGSLFSSRKRREARRLAEEHLRAMLAERGAIDTWHEVARALEADPDADGLLRLAAEVLRMGKERRTAELFDRAADAPHDPQRMFELGSALLSSEHPGPAAAILGRALALVPFDVVVRSELALAHARSGNPQRVLAALALHPCLADDPGALFELAWAALLTGDLDTAQGAARELHGVRSLRRKLELAIDRARAGPPARDARDFYFVEHGGLLVDARGSLAGRHDSLTVDAAWLAAVLCDVGAVVERLVPAPRHVIALDQEHRQLAEALARACAGTVLPPGQGRLPAGVLPLIEGRMIEDRLGDASRRAHDVSIFALTLDWSRSLKRAPEFVGAFARRVEMADGVLEAPTCASAPSSELLQFVDLRRAMLPPKAERMLTAYLPDAPLPR